TDLADDAGAVLREVAFARRAPAGERVRLHDVRRTRGARTGTRLVRSADVTRAGAADGPGVPRRVLAEVARAVAGLGGARVAVVSARGAVRFLRVRRAGRPGDPGAVLREVALAARGAAGEAARLHDVRGTARARPRARLGRVTGVAGTREADRAGSRRGGVRAGVAAAVALVDAAGVAVGGARGAGRFLRVGRAGGGRTAADLREVTFVGRAATRRARRQELAVRAAAHAARDARVAVLARRRFDRAVTAERGEADGDEVSVARLRAARVPGIAADGAAGRRAARLAEPHRRLARVAPHRTAPREAEGMDLRGPAAEPEELCRAAPRQVAGRVAAAVVDVDRRGRAGEGVRREGDVRVASDGADVRLAVTVARFARL